MSPPQKLAAYVISLMDELRIQKPTFWGCSSGGSTVLALVAEHPERVRNGLAHEVQTHEMPNLLALLELPDETISKVLGDGMCSLFCGNQEAWDVLGEECHARLRKNYPRWARGYIRTLGCSFPVKKEDLRGKPLDWTLGASSPIATFFDNIVTATELGIDVGVIPGMHFPYVSDAEAFAAHIVEKTRKYG